MFLFFSLMLTRNVWWTILWGSVLLRYVCFLLQRQCWDFQVYCVRYLRQWHEQLTHSSVLLVVLILEWLWLLLIMSVNRLFCGMCPSSGDGFITCITCHGCHWISIYSVSDLMHCSSGLHSSTVLNSSRVLHVQSTSWALLSLKYLHVCWLEWKMFWRSVLESKGIQTYKFSFPRCCTIFVFSHTCFGHWMLSGRNMLKPWIVNVWQHALNWILCLIYDHSVGEISRVLFALAVKMFFTGFHSSRPNFESASWCMYHAFCRILSYLSNKRKYMLTISVS